MLASRNTGDASASKSALRLPKSGSPASGRQQHEGDQEEAGEQAHETSALR